MKKIIIIVTIILSAALLTRAQNAGGPKIIFEETVFNFDTIIQNENVEHVFRFTNEGESPLLITSAFSSCGCVVSEWPREPVAAKASNCIKVKYNTSKIGVFTKAIVVKSNDVEKPKMVLRINGIVTDGNEKK